MVICIKCSHFLRSGAPNIKSEFEQTSIFPWRMTFKAKSFKKWMLPSCEEDWEREQKQVPYCCNKMETPVNFISPYMHHFSHVQLFVTQWTASRHSPLSVGFSRQQYWSGLPHASPGELLESWQRPGGVWFYLVASICWNLKLRSLVIFLLVENSKAEVPNLFVTMDWFCGRKFAYGPGVGGVVSG